jgi:uncharacterized membrane protein
MQRTALIYWISTALLSVQMILSGIMYFTSPDVSAGFVHFGFPDFFRQELGLAKLVGAVLLLLPQAPRWLKEWTYAGFAITFVSAFIAHTVVDGIGTAMAPLFPLALLVVSYIWWNKRQEGLALAH